MPRFTKLVPGVALKKKTPSDTYRVSKGKYWARENKGEGIHLTSSWFLENPPTSLETKTI